MYLKNLLKSFRASQENNEVKKYYNEIVSLARNSKLYIKGGVPDTLDGRFELIILHCHIFIKRLSNAGPAEKIFAQDLINYMVKDFDRSLREMGVGDLSVGKKIKFMVSAYYGRVNAYDSSIKNKNIFDETLRKNLYGTINPEVKEVKYMKKYIMNLLKFLNSIKDSELKDCFININNINQGLLKC